MSDLERQIRDRIKAQAYRQVEKRYLQWGEKDPAYFASLVRGIIRSVLQELKNHASDSTPKPSDPSLSGMGSTLSGGEDSRRDHDTN